MSSPIKKYSFNKPDSYNHNYYEYDNYVEKPTHIRRVRVKKQKNVFQMFFAFLFFSAFIGAYSYYVCPYNYKNYLEPLFINRFLNRNIDANIKPYVLNTLSYAHNSSLFGDYLMVPRPEKTKMADIQMIEEMTSTKNKLLELFKKYPKLEPSVFVWEYSTGKGFEINSDKVYPSASIIKIPILFELIRLVDRTSASESPVRLSDKRTFNEFFRTSGSGHLQLTKADTDYTLDHLANIMISDSDNSATNMILYEIGGMLNFNRAMRNLGLKITSMGGWLPDIEGYNKTTAREISKILYNIDNPNYINPRYKEILRDYLSSTKNIHLLKEKLPSDTLILHKTGNIGTMLGDSGIIYTDNGKKYIVTILVKRPHNDYRAKLLIQDASLIIFNDIKGLF